MLLHRMIRLALQCILLYIVHISKCHDILPVDGFCPTGEHDLEPCECINMDHKMTGLISIECGPSSNLTSIEEIQDMFTSVDDYPTTNVYRFTLEGTDVTGSLNQYVWGPLDFHQVIMDNNKIWIVDNGAFINSKETLTVLSLKNNEIFYFHWDHLQELPRLYILNLQGNNLDFIPSESFPATDISYLDLSRNMVDYVGPNAFNKLLKLKKVDLSYNLLESLEDNSFNNPEYSNNLHIILSNNQISCISPTAFADVHPEVLDLSDNLLTTVKQDVFMPVIESNIHSLSILLQGNPIVCDCEVFWIKDDQVEGLFSNFGCYDNFGNYLGISFDDLEPSFFDNCTKCTG